MRRRISLFWLLDLTIFLSELLRTGSLLTPRDDGVEDALEYKDGVPPHVLHRVNQPLLRQPQGLQDDLLVCHVGGEHGEVGGAGECPHPNNQ